MDAWQIVLTGGSTGVLFLGIVAIMRGDLRTKQELEGVKLAAEVRATEVKEASDAAIARLDARIAQLIADHERRMAALIEEDRRELAHVREDCQARILTVERDRDYFRTIALRLLETADRSTVAAARAVDLAASDRRGEQSG